MKWFRNGVLWFVGCGIAVSTVVWTPRLFSSEGAPSAPSYQRLIREAINALLKDGNARFVSGNLQHPNLDADRRKTTATEGQQPLATILACSDSREPVEMIFDRGVGDLFVVRVAGNVAGPSELASIEYGVGHLGTPLLVVMGHSKCGAVTAVVHGDELHGHLSLLTEHIKPAAEKAKTEAKPGDDTVAKAIEANIWQTIADVLTQSEEVHRLAAEGQLQVVGAIYNINTGVVAWLGSHPREKELLANTKPSAPVTAAHVTPRSPQEKPSTAVPEPAKNAIPEPTGETTRRDIVPPIGSLPATNPAILPKTMSSTTKSKL